MSKLGAQQSLSLPLCGEGVARSVTGGGRTKLSPSGASRHLPREGGGLEIQESIPC
jgi:hypothetical protein